MTLKQRVRAYLKKRNEPVSHAQLLKVAEKAGVKKGSINQVLYSLEEPDLPNWYGYPTDERNQKGKRQRWYQWIPMSKEEYDKHIADMKWFDSLD